MCCGVGTVDRGVRLGDVPRARCDLRECHPAGRKLLWRKCCPSGMMGEGLGGLCGRWWGGSEDQETVKAPPGAAKWVSAAS